MRRRNYTVMVARYIAGYLYPALAVLSLLLCIPPLVVQARLRHFPAIVLVASLLILNLQNALNAFIWPGWANNAWDGRVYCDIQIRFYSGLPVAIAGAVACLFKQLASAVRTDRVGAVATRSQRIWTWAFDLTLCILFPIIAMSTVYTASYGRYSIAPIIGCNYLFPLDWTAFALQLMWLRISTLVGSWYCTITIFRLVRHRRQVSGMIALSDVSKSRYVRLFLLSFSGIVCLLPMSLDLVIRMILAQPSRNGYSWAQTHPSDWADNIYRFAWRNLDGGELTVRWAQIAFGYPIFALLGLGKEARPLYRATLLRCWKRKKSHIEQGPPSNDVRIATSITRHGEGIGGSVVRQAAPIGRMDEVERELWLMDHEGDLVGEDGILRLTKEDHYIDRYALPNEARASPSASARLC